MKIVFLLALQCLIITSRIVVRDANIAAMSRDDIGMIFYMTLENTAHCPYDIDVSMLQCTEFVDVADRDCSIMYLLGGDMGIIGPKCFKNITLLYPNMYLHNRRGSCLMKIQYTDKHNVVLSRSANISFDTTVSHKFKPSVLRGYYNKNEVTDCRSPDLDPLSQCEPVDCHMKYLGTRNYFNKKWKRCQKVPKCVADSKKGLPDVVYTPLSNKCIDMENLISKTDLRYLQSDDIPHGDQSAIVDQTRPLTLVNCHHGQSNNETGLCDCFDGWTSPPLNKDQYDPSLFYFHMCNIEISNWYDINSGQIKAVAFIIAIAAVFIAISVILVSFIFHIIYTHLKKSSSQEVSDDDQKPIDSAVSVNKNKSNQIDIVSQNSSRASSN